MNNITSAVLFLSLFLFYGIEGELCSENEVKNDYLEERERSPSHDCELKPAILKVEEQVQALRQRQEEFIKKIFEEVGKLQKTVEDNSCLPRKSENVKNCADLYKRGIKQSGVYQIDPDDKGIFNVFCDMTTSGGGWTMFQRRLDGSVDFYRGWQDYKHGFGDLKGEFWLGLDKIHRLTTAPQNELRIDMEDTSGNKKYAEYDLFAVTSEEKNYKMSLGTYAGTAGDSLSTHKGMAFSTKDSDNDVHKDNCAVTFKGGWWYTMCHHSNLNGIYHHGVHDSYADGIIWYHWKKYHYSLKSTSMKIRQGGFGLN